LPRPREAGAAGLQGLGATALRAPAWVGAVLGSVLLGIYLSFATSAFLNTDNLLTVLLQISVVAIMGAGQTFVVVTAGIDLSTAAVAALGGTLVGMLSITYGVPGWASLVIALLAGAGVGLAQGASVAYFGLPAFIITLGGLSIWRGVALQATGGINNTGLPGLIAGMAQDKFLAIPIPVWITVGVFAVAWFVLTQTRFGVGLYSIGGNEEAALLAGVPVRRYKCAAYVISGVLSAFGGIILAGRLDSAGGSIANGYELNVIAAVVIGGTSLFGGEGGPWGAFYGAVLMGLIQNGMNLLGLSAFLQQIVLGSVIVLAVAADALRRRHVVALLAAFIARNVRGSVRAPAPRSPG
jgi:ribose transport system permease protein